MKPTPTLTKFVKSATQPARHVHNHQLIASAVVHLVATPTSTSTLATQPVPTEPTKTMDSAWLATQTAIPALSVALIALPVIRRMHLKPFFLEIYARVVAPVEVLM